MYRMPANEYIDMDVVVTIAGVEGSPSASVHTIRLAVRAAPITLRVASVYSIEWGAVADSVKLPPTVASALTVRKSTMALLPM